MIDDFCVFVCNLFVQGLNALVAYLLICIFFIFGAMCGYSGKFSLKRSCFYNWVSP